MGRGRIASSPLSDEALRLRNAVAAWVDTRVGREAWNAVGNVETGVSPEQAEASLKELRTPGGACEGGRARVGDGVGGAGAACASGGCYGCAGPEGGAAVRINLRDASGGALGQAQVSGADHHEAGGIWGALPGGGVRANAAAVCV